MVVGGLARGCLRSGGGMGAVGWNGVSLYSSGHN